MGHLRHAKESTPIYVYIYIWQVGKLWSNILGSVVYAGPNSKGLIALHMCVSRRFSRRKCDPDYRP